MFLIHGSIPGATLNWGRRLIGDQIKSLVHHIEQNPYLSLQATCETFNVTCNEQFDDESLESTYGLQNKQALLAIRDGKLSTSYESSQFDNEGNWVRVVFGMVKPKEKTVVLVENEKINESQKISEEAFGKLGTFAGLIWV